MDAPFLSDSFTLLPDAAAIAAWLIHDDPRQRVALARRARLAFVLQQPQLRLKGEPAAAVIATVPVQGMHRLTWLFLLSQFASNLGEVPDFLIYFDAVEWRGLGDKRHLHGEIGGSGHPIGRERLVFHELLHLRQLKTADGDERYHEDGREMLALRSHTYENFDEELTLYGPITCGVEQIGLDYVEGAKAEKARWQDANRKRIKLAS